MQRFTKAINWIWENIDPFLALIIGLICSVLGLTANAGQEILTSATLATLTILAFTLIRERSSRIQIQNKTDILIGKLGSPVADDFFTQQSSERLILLHAEKEIWLIQETGSLVTESNREEIISLLRRGGTVRILLTAPIENVARLMALRNANLSYDSLLDRSRLFRAQIANIQNLMQGSTEKLQVRYLPYPIGITSVIVDPTNPVESKRQSLIRFADFMIPYSDKLDFTMRGNVSPRIFAHYFKQAQLLFWSGSKFVLLTGAPRSGKTSLFRELVEHYGKNDNVYYVISEATWDSEERTGFEAFTKLRNGPMRFAERQSTGSYEVKSTIWDEISEELEAALAQNQVILLDEIGQMQLRSERFIRFIQTVLDSPNSFVFATISLDDANVFVKQVKSHYRTSVLYLTANQKDEIRDVLLTELEYACRTNEYVSFDV